MLRNVKIKIIINHQPHHHAHHHHADHHLAIVGPRLPHHEVDLLLRQHLAQGGHRGRKVSKRTMIITILVTMMMIIIIMLILMGCAPFTYDPFTYDPFTYHPFYLQVVDKRVGFNRHHH